MTTPHTTRDEMIEKAAQALAFEQYAPHERLTDLAVVPREKPHTVAAAREQP